MLRIEDLDNTPLSPEAMGLQPSLAEWEPPRRRVLLQPGRHALTIVEICDRAVERRRGRPFLAARLDLAPWPDDGETLAFVNHRLTSGPPQHALYRLVQACGLPARGAKLETLKGYLAVIAEKRSPFSALVDWEGYCFHCLEASDHSWRYARKISRATGFPLVAGAEGKQVRLPYARCFDCLNTVKARPVIRRFYRVPPAAAAKE